jgi:hypothetical protein
VSIPDDELGVTRRAIEISSCKDDQAILIELFLRSMNEEGLWSLQISRPGVEAPENELEGKDRHNNHVIFIWPAEEDGDILTNLINEVEEMKTKASLNPRERFLVIMTDTGDQSPSEAALSVLKELRSKYMILDVLILVPYLTVQKIGRCEFPVASSGINRLLLYTWLPCDQSGEQIILLNAWEMENDGKLLTDSDLFPDKIPYTIISPLRVATLDVEPFVVLEGTYVNENNETVYSFEGPEIELLGIIMKHLNISFYYLPPPPNGTSYFEQLVTNIQRVAMGTADVAIGSLPLDLEAANFVDFTVTYFSTGERWYVPCPRPFPRLKRISRIFHETTWLVMGIVLLLVVVVTWGSAKLAGRKESHSFRSVSGCLLNVCSVFLGVSVSNLPRTSVTRTCFLSFVCYSLAMNTVFQTLLTSVLVDPGFTEQIRSFDEVLYSGIEYGYTKDLHHYYFPAGSELYGEKEVLKHGQNCSDYKECISRVINRGDYVTLRSEIYAEYFVATTMPKRIKPLCSLDSRFKTYLVNMYVQKDTPLLTPLNRIISRGLESAIFYKIINENKDSWRYQVPHDKKYDTESSDETYFVFSTEHLAVAFYVLLFGYGSSFVIFVGELLYCLGIGKLPHMIIYPRKR